MHVIISITQSMYIVHILHNIFIFNVVRIMQNILHNVMHNFTSYMHNMHHMHIIDIMSIIIIILQIFIDMI